jgi:hypothetical protein
MIEPLTLGIGVGAFLFGYTIHSSSNSKSTTQEIDTMLEQNKHIVDLSTTIETLNKDISTKHSHISDLQGEAQEEEENIVRLKTRADYLQNNSKPTNTTKLSKQDKNILLIKESLVKIQNNQVNRFNIGILVSMVRDMYEEIYKEKIDPIGVQKLMDEFIDSDSSGSDSFGKMKHKPSIPKTTKKSGPGR